MDQIEYLGKSAVQELEQILHKERSQNIFIVHGKNSFVLSGAIDCLRPILANYDVEYFSEFSSNPKIDDVKAGIQKFSDGNFDTIIAVGGGSAIDVAKSLKGLSYLKDELEKQVIAQITLTDNKTTFIAIPTTAGSGSEATHFSVIYVKGRKYSLSHPSLLPKYALIDYSLTLRNDKHLTAVSGMDALCQAIESYWSVRSTVESKMYAGQALKLVLKNIEPAVNDPSDRVREDMMKGAHKAGKAINISKTTACHALSYTFTNKFNIPHGHAVGLTIGSLFKKIDELIDHGTVADKRGKEFVRDTMLDLYAHIGVSNASEAHLHLNNLKNAINLENRISKLGVNTDAFKMILEEVSIDRLSNTPVELQKDDLIEIVTDIL